MAGAYALLAILVVPIYPHFVSPNEFTRWAFDVAVLHDGALEVTRHVAQFGPRFEDVAVRDGRFYMNKAPGTALLTIPAHAFAELFSIALRPTLTAMRLAASTLPVILLALLFVRFGVAHGADPARIRTVVWMLLFATPLFAYGLLMFAHALVAAALFGAWMMLEEQRPLAAGLLTGLAVASEYTAVFAAAVLLIAAISSRRMRTVARFIAGGIPFAVLLAAYHVAAFGSVLANPYSMSAHYRELHQRGWFGLQFPSPVTAAKILFDPAYGLLVFSPVLILGVMALRDARKRLSAPAWQSLVTTPAVLLIVYAGYEFWYGGWNVGPRFLVPAVPFLLAPLLFRPAGAAESVLAGASTCAVVTTTIAFPFVPQAFAFPWSSLALPLLHQGLIAPNLLHFAGRTIAIAGLFAVVLTATIAGAGIRRCGSLALGAAAVLAMGTLWPRFTQEPLVRVQRHYIAAVYFERGSAPGAMPPGLMRRRAIEQHLPPGSWPFAR